MSNSKVKSEVLGENTHYEYSLINDGKQAEASHYAKISRSGDGIDYREVAVEIYDAKGNLDACIIVGLDSQTLEPVIHCTSNGEGDGDMNVAIRPMRPTEECVEVYMNRPIPANRPA